MKNLYHRKKQPETVRRALLDQAARLAVEQGMAAVTVQAVADAAGVTKGGLTHHFPNKQALIEAVFQDLLNDLENSLHTRAQADPTPQGSFTRAYVIEIFDMDPNEKGGLLSALSVLLLVDPRLRTMWAEWFDTWLDKGQHTDGSMDLAVVRLAVDGVWLADLCGLSLPDRAQLRDKLILATYPET
ncbi:TetR/AcrR family transcriptional regulator [Roseovarius pelagicus]|uniref:TetR/AcrR family transcriptional regulator n=1 Tax=Roseovarius pelagicus TaxID=2980108 RepID=A0ABY6DGQ9_9RHOB|nr:TetR/AcrR family transcriptional regulator [Roseovarius pelagicus]UXX84148.1 TetR/AcrR family transcriptional regulator [Roseovarius pelagicus]